jgi:hypothetical protein
MSAVETVLAIGLGLGEAIGTLAGMLIASWIGLILIGVPVMVGMAVVTFGIPLGLAGPSIAVVDSVRAPRGPCGSRVRSAVVCASSA